MSLKDFEKIYPGIRNGEGYGTDKFVLGYVHEFYAEHFEPIKDKVKSVMEIGIGYSPGGDSILLWHEFFSNAKIYGLDIQTRPDRPEFHIEQPRIKLFTQTDAYTQEMVNTMRDLEPDGYDIFIDDDADFFFTKSTPLQQLKLVDNAKCSFIHANGNGCLEDFLLEHHDIYVDLKTRIANYTIHLNTIIKKVKI